MTFFRLIALLFPALFLGNLPAKAEQKVIALAFQGEPWSITADQKSGVIPRFYKILAASSNLELDVKIVPYKRMLAMLEAGQGNIAVFFKSAKSAKVAQPQIHLANLDTIVFPRLGTKIDRYEDLHGLSIGVKRGVSYLPRFDNDENINHVDTNSYLQSVNMLYRNRFNAIVGSEASIYYNLARAGKTPNPQIKPFTLSTKEVWLQTSLKTQLGEKVQKQLFKAAQLLADQGKYKEVLNDLTQELSLSN